jgi:molybdopterin/thiamine biosynthesis adenylyltransferase
LAFRESTWNVLTNWLENPLETAGVLTARLINDDAGMTLLVRDLHEATIDSYIERREDRLSLSSLGWVNAVRRTRDDASMAIFVHSHPFGPAAFSEADDEVDSELKSAFFEHSGIPMFGSLVIAGSKVSPEFAGRLETPNADQYKIDVVRIVGDQLLILRNEDIGEATPQFDRQVRALGTEGQSTIRNLRVGIVGAGGTGSAIVEQLIRLGVGNLVIIDDDVVTPATIARGYGSHRDDIGKTKVELLARLAEQINSDTNVDSVFGNIQSEMVALRLRHCDVIFCCADSHGARIVLNRMAYAQLSPVIDVAILISSSGEKVTGIDGRVTWLAPGASCLLCRNRIDAMLANAENLDPVERHRLAGQGYVPEIEDPQPSVVAYTTLMASFAVTELLNRLFGFSNVEPTEMIVRLLDRHISANRVSTRVGCFCDDREFYGRGTEEPFLGIAWVS